MLTKTQLELRTQGFSVIKGSDLAIDPIARESEEALACEWDSLGPDDYLKNGARFRRRRYGRFYYLPRSNTIYPLRHKPYFQSAKANLYAGGVHRIIDPLTQASITNPLMNALIKFDFAQLPVKGEMLDRPWEVTCHQFRIIATVDKTGEPTPEGIHRDEVDYGAIHLISRSNAEGGYSRIYDNAKNLKAQFLLESAMDTMFWADHEVLHSVTPVTAKDMGRSAIRDVLDLAYIYTPGLTEAD